MSSSDSFLPFWLSCALLLASLPLFSLYRRLPQPSSSSPLSARFLSMASPTPRRFLSPVLSDPNARLAPLETRRHFRASHVGNRSRGGGYASSSAEEADEDPFDLTAWRVVYGKQMRGEEAPWIGRSALKGGRQRASHGSVPEGTSAPDPRVVEAQEACGHGLGLPGFAAEDDTAYEDYDLDVPSTPPLMSLPTFPDDDFTKRVRLSEPLGSKAALAALRSTFAYAGVSAGAFASGLGAPDDRPVYKRTPPSSRGERRSWMEAQAKEAAARAGHGRVLRSAARRDEPQGREGADGPGSVQPPHRRSSLLPDPRRETDHACSVLGTGMAATDEPVRGGSDDDKWGDALNGEGWPRNAGAPAGESLEDLALLQPLQDHRAVSGLLTTAASAVPSASAQSRPKAHSAGHAQAITPGGPALSGVAAWDNCDGVHDGVTSVLVDEPPSPPASHAHARGSPVQQARGRACASTASTFAGARRTSNASMLDARRTSHPSAPMTRSQSRAALGGPKRTKALERCRRSSAASGPSGAAAAQGSGTRARSALGVSGGKARKSAPAGRMSGYRSPSLSPRLAHAML